MSNSDNEKRDGCLKWYIFNDELTANNLNMILDHNTISTIEWNSNGISTNPPNTINNHFSALNWQVTPRLISANEVAKIVKHPTFDENTTSSRDWFYFGSLTKDFIKDTKHGWLFDRTYRDCTKYGCANNSSGSNNTLIGYWTSSRTFNYNEGVWMVDSYGKLNNDFAANSLDLGARPVISIPKITLIK